MQQHQGASLDYILTFTDAIQILLRRELKEKWYANVKRLPDTTMLLVDVLGARQ